MVTDLFKTPDASAEEWEGWFFLPQPLGYSLVKLVGNLRMQSSKFSGYQYKFRKSYVQLTLLLSALVTVYSKLSLQYLTVWNCHIVQWSVNYSLVPGLE